MEMMQTRDKLLQYSKEELVDLIELYAKDSLALDGVWFQSVEKESGMDAAILHDRNAWERFTVVEAQRIKRFLGLPEHPGLEGLAKALQLRFNAHVVEADTVLEEDRLVYTIRYCRVQAARERKGMPYHPCKPVGLVEYAGFGRAIDERITCRCLSCYPDVQDETCCCSWEYRLDEAALGRK
jgi:hypothetical protein